MSEHIPTVNFLSIGDPDTNQDNLSKSIVKTRGDEKHYIGSSDFNQG